MVSGIPILIYPLVGLQSDMLLIRDAVFDEVGHKKAVDLTWAIHDSIKHVPISLLLVGIRGSPRDSAFKFERQLGLPSRYCGVFRRVASTMFLLVSVDE